MSDSDIETLIGRAAAKTRRNAWNRSSRVIKDNLTTGNLGGRARFAIIGEEGARQLDETFRQDNLTNLSVAKEMFTAGKDAKTVKLATGWEKGGDGKWRMEVPDIEMKTTKLFLGKEEKIHPPVKLSGYLDQIIDAPELFASYPELKNVIVTTGELPRNVSGRYIPQQKRIIVKDTLTPLQLDNIRRLNQRIQKTANWSEKDTKAAQMLRLEADPAKVRQQAQSSLDIIANVQLYEYRLVLIHEIQHAIQEMEGFAQGGSTQELTLDEYRRLGGEVESRNAVSRSRMSTEEKRQSLLSETEDVAEESKIYLFGESGENAFAPLRKQGAPNTAGDKGNIRDGNVPCAPGFIEWAGLKGKRIAADYEFLLGHHPEYFKSQEEVRAAVELVLSKPEKVKDINGNLSFVGFDEITGVIYRLEISPIVKNKANYIRSIFEITAKQYQKNKLAESPILQSVTTEDKQSAVRTLANFMHNISPNPENANRDFTDEYGGVRKGTESYRFAVAPEETEWEKAVISVLRPVVGESVELSKEEIAAKVKELYGLDLSPDQAKLYAYLAAAENRSINASRQIAANKKRAFEYFEDLHNYFYHFRQAGEGLFINPGKEFEGEEVSGTFISENFRKYSHKRPQRKNESDKHLTKV